MLDFYNICLVIGNKKTHQIGGFINIASENYRIVFALSS